MCVAKLYFNRQRFARAIIDAETLRSMFLNFRAFLVSAVTLRAYSFHKCILMTGAEPVPRDLKAIPLVVSCVKYITE